MMVSSETISSFGMQSTFDSDPLLPRLTSLTFVKMLGHGDTASTLAVLALLSPKITALSLTLPRHDDILFQPILSIASDRCPWLQELVLDLDSLSPHLPNAIEGLIAACRHTLRTLEVRSSSEMQHLQVVANLPQLRNLRLERVQLPRDLPPSTFPSLEELAILRFDGGPLQRFFEPFGNVGLKVVKIHNSNTVSLKESMETLSRFLASLEVLAMPGVASLNLSGLVIPHPLTNLKSLYVVCRSLDNDTHRCSPLRPNDKFIAKLGAAMPNITHLTMGSPTCPHLESVTFLSLVGLSKTCKRLEILTMRVNSEA